MKRNVPVSIGVYDAVDSNASTLTSGVAVSLMVNVADAGEPTSYGVVVPRTRMTVSGPSVVPSAIGLTTTVVVVAPAAKDALSGTFV